MGAGAIANWGPLTATLASSSPAEPDALPLGRVILATGPGLTGEAALLTVEP